MYYVIVEVLVSVFIIFIMNIDFKMNQLVCKVIYVVFKYF